MNNLVKSLLTIYDKILQENGLFSFHSSDTDDRFEEVDGYLFLSLGFTSKRNAWAGPDHWKYQKAKGRFRIVHPKCSCFEPVDCFQGIIMKLFFSFRGSFYY